MVRKVCGAMMAVLLVAAATAGYAAAADKVGFINLQRLVQESKMGKAASADIQRMRKEKQAMVNKKLAEVNRLQKQINDNAAKMSLKERQDRIEILQKANKEYQRMVADAKEDIVREDRELVAIILQKADGVLKKVAKKNGYALILKDAKVIGYLDPAVDITDAVLKELNKK